MSEIQYLRLSRCFSCVDRSTTTWTVVWADRPSGRQFKRPSTPRHHRWAALRLPSLSQGQNGRVQWSPLAVVARWTSTLSMDDMEPAILSLVFHMLAASNHASGSIPLAFRHTIRCWDFYQSLKAFNLKHLLMENGFNYVRFSLVHLGQLKLSWSPRKRDIMRKPTTLSSPFNKIVRPDRFPTLFKALWSI